MKRLTLLSSLLLIGLTGIKQKSKSIIQGNKNTYLAWIDFKDQDAPTYTGKVLVADENGVITGNYIILQGGKNLATILKQ